MQYPDWCRRQATIPRHRIFSPLLCPLSYICIGWCRSLPAVTAGMVARCGCVFSNVHACPYCPGIIRTAFSQASS